jgi:hemerythrin
MDAMSIASSSANPQGAPKFQWDDRYRLGNELIDTQHKTLIELANSIPSAQGKSEVQAAVMAVYKYTRKHFSDEEELMRQVGFPRYKEHQELHHRLVGELNELSSRNLGDEASVLDFRTFVYKWIVNHLMHNDRELVDFVNSLPPRP